MKRTVVSSFYGWIANAVLRHFCKHPEYDVLTRLGPTGRGKLWQGCRCKRCQGYFVQELMTGYRKNTKHLSMGIQELL